MYSNFKLIVCEKNEEYKLSKNIENQHDKLFKDLLNNKEELKSFLFDYLKIDIRDKEIEKCSNSYISREYRVFESDIVYKIKNENKYILVEHQSSIDERMPYRILNYSTEILKEVVDEKYERNRNYKYPLIIPIVLYTGERKWTANIALSKKTENGKKKYLEMKYELVDINQYNEEELLNKKTAISYAMLIEKNKGKDSLIKILDKIVMNCDNKQISNKMQKIIQYLLYPILGEDTEKMVKKFNKKEEFDMKTAQDYIREEIAEIRRQGIEEGKRINMKTAQDYIKEEIAEIRRQGIEEGKRINMKTAQDYIKEEIAEIRRQGKEEGKSEGIKQERKMIVLNMIKSKIKIEKIKEYTGIDKEEIEKIAASI